MKKILNALGGRTRIRRRIGFEQETDVGVTERLWRQRAQRAFERGAVGVQIVRSSALANAGKVDASVTEQRIEIDDARRVLQQIERLRRAASMDVETAKLHRPLHEIESRTAHRSD